jgi:hypothetical protein
MTDANIRLTLAPQKADLAAPIPPASVPEAQCAAATDRDCPGLRDMTGKRCWGPGMAPNLAAMTADQCREMCCSEAACQVGPP